MADKLPVFLRPIVIDSSNKDFTYEVGGGGASAKALTTGTYPCIAAVMNEIETQCANITASFSTSFKVVLTHSSTTFEIVWTDSNLRDLLGFRTGISGNTTYTADYTPMYSWVPSRSRADNNEWSLDHKSQWSGYEARSGVVCGFRTGTAIYRNTFEFEALASYEILKSKCTAEIYRNRCLDTFVENAREVWGDVNAPSPSGFYVYHDRTQVSVGASSTWDSGDASKLNYSSGNSTFVFAYTDPKWYPNPKQTLKNCRSDYTDIEIDLHSATAPTWTGA